MKKALLTLAAAVGMGFAANATDVTVNYSALGYGNAEDVTTVATGDSNISIVCAQGANTQNPPKYYNTGTGLRMYVNNTMTISAAAGTEITDIVFNAAANNYAVKGTVNVGDFTQSGATSTWSGNASEIVLTSSSTCRLQTMVITYTTTAPKDVEDVKIDTEIENGEAVVTLTCATEGATIKYGFAEDAMDNVYTAPFTVTEKATVYAQAELDGKYSAVATKAIALPAKFTSLKALVNESVTGESVVAVGNFSVIYQSSNEQYLIVTDGTSNALVYNPGAAYAVGTKFSQMMGTATIYSGLFELTAATLTEGGEGAEYVPAEVTSLSSIDIEENIFDEIELKNATVSGVSGSNATITLNGETIALYNRFGITLENADNADILAFVWRYNDNLQLAPVSIEGKVIPAIDAPVFDPASSELKVGDKITITCATEGVNIYYTTDGEDPTEESTLYTEPIEFTEAVTIKARAYSADPEVEMIPSDVVEAIYKLYDPNKPVATEVTFDFTTLDGIEFWAGFEAPTTQGVDVEEPFSKDDVTISTANSGTTKARIWSTTSDGWQFRVYKGDVFTIAAPDTYSVKTIEFAIKSGTIAPKDDELGTYANKIWTAAEKADAKEVAFEVSANAQITSITVTLDKTVGVAGIEADENVAPVYYTLQGVRVENPSNGLYIVVRGNKATKQVIR